MTFHHTLILLFHGVAMLVHRHRPAAEIFVIQYRGFKVTSSSTPMLMSGGSRLEPLPRTAAQGVMIEIARIERKLFETMKEAEAHGRARARVGGSKIVRTIVAGLLVFLSAVLLRDGKTISAGAVGPGFGGGSHIAVSAARSRIDMANRTLRV